MDNGCKTLWLVTARGGSKGIPGKNLKPFCGESLTGRAIRQALECANPQDTVFLSTDSEEIRQEGLRYGIDIPFLRPPHLASDNASSYSVILHVLEELQKNGEEFQRMVLLQPTSPLRTVEDIKGALKLWQPAVDMVVSVSDSDANPYYNLFETDKEGYLKISKGNGEYLRRQDAPPVWQYNGAVYVMTVKSLLKGPMSTFKKVVPYEMPRSRSIDLDTPQDWLIAESLFQTLSP